MPITSSNKGGISSGDSGPGRRREYEGPIFDVRPENQNTQSHHQSGGRERSRPRYISPYDPRIGMNLVAPIPKAEFARMQKKKELQRKSSLPDSSPEDKEEKEADAIAEKVSGASAEKISGKGTKGGTLDKKSEARLKSIRGRPLKTRETRLQKIRTSGSRRAVNRYHLYSTTTQKLGSPGRGAAPSIRSMKIIRIFDK